MNKEVLIRCEASDPPVSPDKKNRSKRLWMMFPFRSTKVRSLGLVGESGSGKSTVARCLDEYISAHQQGEIWYKG